MKRLTAVVGVVLGIGVISSFMLLPTAASLEGGNIDDMVSIDITDSTLEVASYRPDNKTKTNTPRESILMNHVTVNSSSASPFNADTFVKPSDLELKERLSSLEYKVTQKDGTERAFSNVLHDEKRAGLYVDIVSGEPLFSSSDKFDSKTGWPSFVRPIADDVVVEKDDRSLFGTRTEIRSTLADSHLGHVFSDGPAPTGNRYCMNAAAMRFIPVEKMDESGYGAYIERVSVSSVSS